MKGVEVAAEGRREGLGGAKKLEAVAEGGSTAEVRLAGVQRWV